MKPVNGQDVTPSHPAHQAPPPAPVPQAAAWQTPKDGAAPQAAAGQIRRDIVNIGKSIVIKGELKGSEDLTLEGQVEGTIDLRDNVLTIGPNGKIKAQVFAKTVIVTGAVTGNITASEKIDIRDGGSVEGDLVSPRVGISEGAHFRGSVDMKKKGGQDLSQRSAPTQSTPVHSSGVAAHQQGAPVNSATAH